jgi:uncharacterized repeat protein (TIGR02543 family)
MIRTKQKTLLLFATGLALVFTLALSGCSKTYYTVTFNSNGGSAVAALSVENGDSIGEENFPKPTKASNVFGGWYTDNSVWTKRLISLTPIGADTTVYAMWKPDTPTKTLTVDYGWSSDASIKYKDKTTQNLGSFVVTRAYTDFKTVNSANDLDGFYYEWDNIVPSNPIDISNIDISNIDILDIDISNMFGTDTGDVIVVTQKKAGVNKAYIMIDIEFQNSYTDGYPWRKYYVIDKPSAP